LTSRGSTPGETTPSSTGRRAFWWLATAVYAVVIWWFSSQPGSAVGLPPPWDKIVHGLTYAVLGGLAALAMGSVRRGFLLAALYGAIDEAHQAFSPGRSPDYADWLVDMIGALVGAMIVNLGQIMRKPASHTALSYRK
jgi:VanZ family protein